MIDRVPNSFSDKPNISARQRTNTAPQKRSLNLIATREFFIALIVTVYSRASDRFNLVTSSFRLITYQIPASDLLTWFSQRARGLGRSKDTVELAHNSSHPFIAPDHPNPPFPVNPAPSVGNPASPSSEYLSAASQVSPSPRVNRRRRLPSPDRQNHFPASTGPLLAGSTREPASPDYPSSHFGRPDGRSPSPKRRRLATMRPDGSSTENGFSEASNGSHPPTPRKMAPNGQMTAANGDSHTNGSTKPLQSSTYYGHNREQVTRILIQSLHELGYTSSASQLSSESGFELETSGVATFRSAVLGGRWAEAERILIQSFKNAGSQLDRKSPPEETLVLAEGADRNGMMFYLRQQKFLELLEARDLAAALSVLRQELTPLKFDVDRLHALSRYVSCRFAVFKAYNLLIPSFTVFSCAQSNYCMTRQSGKAL